MNSTSLIFALGMAALVAGTALLIDWGAHRNHHWSTGKRRLVMRLMMLLALLTGVYVYHTDATMRGTTLFEIAGPWEGNGDRLWIVEVEHPGVEHTLAVYPNVPGLESASRPLILRCRFGIDGDPPLIENESVYEVVRKSGKNAGGTTWDSETFRFKPTRPGAHQFIISAPDGYPPKIHVRIADPENRDGQRAKGY